MALFTLTVQHAERTFTTQLAASSPDAAISFFFARLYPTLRESGLGSSSPHLSEADVLFIAPMAGLANVWAANAGRSGEYVSVVCSLTASGPEA